MIAPPLDLDLLRSFVLVAEEGGIARAAVRVGRTQSAVSMQMQRLEDVIGRPILKRVGRATGLTPTGETLLGHARRLLRAQEDAWRELTAPELTGSLRLGTPDDYALTLLPPLLARFGEEHPAVDLQITCEPSQRLVPKVAAGDLDLAVVTCEMGSSIRGLRREPIIWVASPNFQPELRRPLPVALYKAGCISRDRALKALDGTGVEYREAYASDSMIGLLTAVRAGLAIAAMPACAAPPDLRKPGVVEGLPSLGHLEIGLAVGASEPGSATEALARMLTDFLGR
ncbi:LysR substrate-binding domain-containing protein [Lacibacterium aquatile]|uniref:LysR substrate-binding domain-containing protein n=1 Tax=Lacibacterium aquatile TaxID=1168082 RepID=A0ABW5DLY1_9PROT